MEGSGAGRVQEEGQERGQGGRQDGEQGRRQGGRDDGREDGRKQGKDEGRKAGREEGMCDVQEQSQGGETKEMRSNKFDTHLQQISNHQTNTSTLLHVFECSRFCMYVYKGSEGSQFEVS